jgi:threonylcarbamoyladenosine tRNA methylthiotransferase MtaB
MSGEKEKKLFIETYGCQMNVADSEVIASVMKIAGYEPTDAIEDADAVFLNTCSIRDNAEQKIFSRLDYFASLRKKRKSRLVLGVLGCMAERVKDELIANHGVDIVAGPDAYLSLPDLVSAAELGEKAINIQLSTTETYRDVIPQRIGHNRISGYISIMRGCNNFCSYCIVPYTRGRVRSRQMEDVVREVEELAASGYKEIVLTGIHLSSYGVDFEEENIGLLDLIVRLDQVPGVERIRLGSLEPRIITEEFAGTLAGLKSFCPHFHLSLQSGCDETLKRMNRHYTTEDYAHRCEILRKYFENPAITTDVIVGFPQETEEEFETTREFLRRVHFYEMHVFKYSRREGTRAAVMEGQVPEQEKNRRSDILLDLEAELSDAYRRSFLGKEEEVLLEERVSAEGRDYMIGHTRQYVKAVVPYREGLKNVTVRGKLGRMVTDEILFLAEE